MKKQNGITLVALVITIIILIILAGIAIASFRDSNLFIKANDAKTNTQAAQEEENRILNEYSNYITNYTSK